MRPRWVAFIVGVGGDKRRAYSNTPLRVNSLGIGERLVGAHSDASSMNGG
ncbi:MAG: hypothetical protein HXX08_22850 [Chloroflexi bacterium]|uniref:Uncharacterized protein n=1 Tax=Candidatus Chlorohelix allophototropha TaxID=3003348 RepID=A0A8T7M9A9_9CHLR|nr:hypothetical protein [Chloroflexota bacterium]WJW68639.1 hypothetical protein OZ401_004253 [Chloroflexota bacterium L227-S17]